jgi:microcystin degradation protein MlrC
VGPSAKLAVSYDLHANLSSGIVVDPADVLIAYRTNPHWDLAPTGFRAGNRLIRALRGHIAPVHAWRKLPVVLGRWHDHQTSWQPHAHASSGA